MTAASDFELAYARRLGAQMRAVRGRLGLSLSQAEAKCCGQFQSRTVGAWERGRSAVSCKSLTAYAGAIGVPVRDMLPPEPDRQARIEHAVTRAAERAVTALVTAVPNMPRDAARNLLCAALAAPGTRSSSTRGDTDE